MYVKIPRQSIKRMEIVMTDCKMTLDQVVKKYGCTYAINGGLYNMKTGKVNDIPLRVNGQTAATSKYGYWMLAWNNGPDMKMIHSKDMEQYKWAIACGTMLKDGQQTSFPYSAAQGGNRGRTGFGDDKNNVILYCTTDKKNPMTPEELRAEMQKIGALDAIMLDSGGSSQMYNNGTYLWAEHRKVANWICVWTTESENKITPIEQIKCPFQEPTENIKYGSRGNGVKWVQWHLNKAFGNRLVVDGICGTTTKNYIIQYQKIRKLAPDGICGKATRKALKQGV